MRGGSATEREENALNGKMKRAIGGLVCFFTLLCGTMAQAQPACAPYDFAQLVPSYTVMNAGARAALDALYEAAWYGETEVTWPRGTRYDDVAEAIHTLRDYPIAWAMTGEIAILYAQNDPEHALKTSIDYKLSTSERRDLLAWAQSLAGVSRRADDWETALALYDAVRGLAEYDLDAPNAHTAYGALMEGRAVCDGYAGAFALLCRLNGIPCGVLTGRAWSEGKEAEHAWNLLLLCGRAVVADPTWDDQTVPLYAYFAVTDDMLNNHERDERSARLPAATGEGITWHDRRGMRISADEGRDAVFAHLRALVLTGQPICLRFDAEADFASARDTDALLTAYNAQAPANEQLVGACHVAAEEAARCLYISR